MNHLTSTTSADQSNGTEAAPSPTAAESSVEVSSISQSTFSKNELLPIGDARQCQPQSTNVPCIRLISLVGPLQPTPQTLNKSASRPLRARMALRFIYDADTTLTQAAVEVLNNIDPDLKRLKVLAESGEEAEGEDKWLSSWNKKGSFTTWCKNNLINNKWLDGLGQDTPPAPPVVAVPQATDIGTADTIIVPDDSAMNIKGGLKVPSVSMNNRTDTSPSPNGEQSPAPLKEKEGSNQTSQKLTSTEAEKSQLVDLPCDEEAEKGRQIIRPTNSLAMYGKVTLATTDAQESFSNLSIMPSTSVAKLSRTNLKKLDESTSKVTSTTAKISYPGFDTGVDIDEEVDSEQG